MSTRLYPAVQRGKPQLRVFLPDFWMKLVKPDVNLLPNQVQFIVSPQMTRLDVKQYLEKIYNVPVVHVITHNRMGKTTRSPKGFIIKEDDYKVAIVNLPKETTFTFPDLFPKAKEEELSKEMKVFEQTKEEFKQKTAYDPARKGIPSWFGL